MARHTPGNYVPLDVNYPSDRGIRAAGEAAELLFVRGLAYCKRTKTDGYVPDYDLPVVAVGLRNVPKRVAALVKHGLWVREGDGYRVRSWPKWNRPVTSEEAFTEGQSKAGSKGNHERWHAARGVTDADCGWCDPNREPDRVADSGSDRAPESPIREGKGREVTAGPRKRGHRIPDDFRPSDDLCAWARDRGFNDAQITEITETFTRHWQAASGASASKLDWPKAWQNWVAKEDPRRVRGVALAAVPADRPLTGEQLLNILGPDRWSCPRPPAGLSPDEEWEWRRQQQVAHIEERQQQARARTGASA